jgi:Na+/H+ antiporter NhaD/arsenite permease-like protein
MLKLLMMLFLSSLSLFAASGASGTAEVAPDLTMTWVGFACLFIFVVGYYFVAAEEKYEIDKAKPALFIGTFMFILVALYYALNGLNLGLVHTEAQHLILEIAGIFFFLFVAMTYIESLIHMGVFDRLKYNLVSKGYTYRKLLLFYQLY